MQKTGVPAKRVAARLAALRSASRPGGGTRAITDLPIRGPQESDVKTPDGRSRARVQRTQPINAYGEQTASRIARAVHGRARRSG